jgi:hypothetical protein
MAHIVLNAPNTPLRPHTLAAFLPWGSFAGAGRPARRKGNVNFEKKENNFPIEKFIPEISLDVQCRKRAISRKPVANDTRKLKGVNDKKTSAKVLTWQIYSLKRDLVLC